MKSILSQTSYMLLILIQFSCEHRSSTISPKRHCQGNAVEYVTKFESDFDSGEYSNCIHQYEDSYGRKVKKPSTKKFRFTYKPEGRELTVFIDGLPHKSYYDVEINSFGKFKSFCKNDIKSYDISTVSITFIQKKDGSVPLGLDPGGFIYYYNYTESYYSPTMQLVE